MPVKPPIGRILEHYGWDGRVHGYGAWKSTRCPFHGDRHASGRVNENEDVFHCHACGISGDSYKVVEQTEGVSFAEAVRLIQGWTGESYGSVSGGSESGRSLLPSWTRARRRGNRALPARGSRAR